MISTIEELTALDDLGVSRHMVQNEFFAKWQPNIAVSVWGRGKATLVNKKLCPDTGVTGTQQYAGNCDECRYFMGCKFPNGTASIAWGDHVQGCCALVLNEQLQHEVPALAD